MTASKAPAEELHAEAPTAPSAAVDLRTRIAVLRHELMLTDQKYQEARRNRRVDQVVALLRKRSVVIQQLFDAQRDLIVRLRREVETGSGSLGPGAVS
jgi:hypothetical protein